ncbi:MAG: 4-demethylwyosine synthase TYW1 [Candidatus Thermoplasmatota archaeon]
MDYNLLRKQKYKIVGEHSGVKLCHWMRQKLFYGRACYKEKFYGINTHRCIQMTPTVDICNQCCLFCWRIHSFGEEIEKWDSAEYILEKCIQAQREIISGFKGDERCNLQLWNEAREPNQIAISLAGEPTFYPYLDELIESAKKKGMRTFLVTNGTKPEVIEEMENLPTQLYVSITAPNEEIYKKLCLPREKDGWKKILATLSLLESLNSKTRVVIRNTLVDGWNIGYEEQYAKLIERAQPLFIEPKGYMFVGHSRLHLSLKNMPSHKKVLEFGKKLAELTGYNFIDEKEDSRVVLLCKKSYSPQIPLQ